MLTRRLIVFGAIAALSGCALEKQPAPTLTGPSELALSLTVTATPDVVTQDGQSLAAIDIVARDAYSQPQRGLTLRVETLVNDVAMDFGTLSSRSVSTNNDGRATLSYRAPAAPPATAPDDTIVTIAVTPLGTDYSEAVSRTIKIRLTRPGVILPPNGAPTPDFFYSPAAPREGDAVVFDGSTSKDSDGQIVSYSWSFGDGGTATGVRATHTYALNGSYNVVLTVADDRGVTVSSAPKQVQVGTSALPTPDFTYSPIEPIVNQLINFNATMTRGANGRTITSFDWDFGDGSPHARTVTAQHAYAVEGTFTVVLNVMDDTGRTSAVSKEIEITTAKPKADFSVSPPTATAGLTAVTFNGTLSTAPPGRTIAGYSWDFGDGSSSTAATPSHTFAAPGTYTVVLTVTDSAGAVGITSKTVSVTP